MKKIAAITFHHAHNFGSMLQAYALQVYVKSLYDEIGEPVEYTIIDYYSEVQEELYGVYKSGLSVRSIVKNLVTIPYAKQLQIKHQKFEVFLAEQCCMTKRYKNKNELKDSIPEADIYISGGDQIWNVRAKDYSPVYYLNFLNDKAERISYAASFGPLKIDWTKYDIDGYKALLKKYAAISVREPGSIENIKELTGADCSINADPTLLLTTEQWRMLQSGACYRDGQYILLYCLEPSKMQLKMADIISKRLKLPIVVLKYNNKNDMLNHFVKKYDSGPKDFLAYIDNAALVLSSSFHGTAFSLIYHKPFYVFNGMSDNRISSILTRTKMIQRSLENIEDVKKVTLEIPNIEAIQKLLDEERRASREYLRRALKIE
ncbi:polysaccharide pyruvyl transferase family protein [Enterocloster bolteae]|uniref:polysaccharide pyruvyl transferase family protein n=1 Tax=Enterocloster bolteae TaxID=208479 RepID=UPI00189DE59F|nr:polysaccharide pyruvyl transferase family protein [Enterocloster bolteae]